MKDINKTLLIIVFSMLIIVSPSLLSARPITDADAINSEKEPEFSGVDEHTIALWLFDEAPYYNVTLTDAGPFQLDLRLNTGYGKPLPASVREGRRGLLPGHFGGALHLPMGDSTGVSWAEGIWLSSTGTARMFDRRQEVPEICNLGYLDYTIEFWFKSLGAQIGPGVVWEVRNEGSGKAKSKAIDVHYNALVLDNRATHFRLRGRMTRQEGARIVNWDPNLQIPTDAARLNDGQWRHLVFTYTAAEHQMRHYLDGRLQPLPKIGGFLPLSGLLVSMTLGRDAEGEQQLFGALDEFRISDVVRYRKNFELPGSFARNFGSQPPATDRANGPPLLFGKRRAAGPLAIGARKQLFIDNALVEHIDESLTFTSNPPIRIEVTDFRNSHPWEPTPRMGSAISDICSFWDDGDKISMLYSNSGMWGGKAPAICLATSRDGLHWEKPELGLHAWNGSTRNNIVLRNALQGTAIKDPNPAAPDDQRYKMLAWLMRRGLYILTSPDGVHWQRNECAALPFDPDGSCEIFWDDQIGQYRAYLRAASPRETPFIGRRIAYAKTADVMRPWPFTPVREPLWAFTLPRPAADELPLIDTGGEVYRMKAVKYPWAPDVYLAFPWRHFANIRPGSFLMVSRNGEDWHSYETPFYFASGWELEGRQVLEALMEQGMIRRGDEIWQYGTARFTEHGGARYGGVEHDGSGFDRLLRLTQRLDGFVSIDATEGPGTIVTRPLTFSGRQLELNVAATGAIRVALLGEDGKPLPGFRIEECDPVRVDAVRHLVTWRGKSDLSRHAGRTVQVQFELRRAKLFAFQFLSTAEKL